MLPKYLVPVAMILIISCLIFNMMTIREGFKSPGPEYLYPDIDPSSPELSHSVDMPINTTFQCANFCGPKAQCLNTREQCTSDVDCTGCQPKFTPLTKNTHDVRAENDAGKLTYNQTPQYSTLTTDMGTQAKFVSPYAAVAQVPSMYMGLDAWEKAHNVGMHLFEKKSQTSDDEYTPSWIPHTSTTGLFETSLPRAANAYLSL
jgi:hypothetical protein